MMNRTAWPIVFILPLAACAGPQDVAEGFLTAIASGDAAAAKKTLCLVDGYQIMDIQGFTAADIVATTEENLSGQPVTSVEFTYQQTGFEGTGFLTVTSDPRALIEAQQQTRLELGLPPAEITDDMFTKTRPCIISVTQN